MSDLIPVDSSNIEAVGFDSYTDDESIGILIVRFKSGGEFRYFDVPHAKYKAMLEAESKGKFYFANVKGKYEHHKRTPQLDADLEHGIGEENTSPRAQSNAEIPGEDEPKSPRGVTRTGTIDL